MAGIYEASYRPVVAIPYSKKVGGTSVLSLSKGFVDAGCDSRAMDYRKMMEDISDKEFKKAYSTLSGRKKLFAHAKAKAAELLTDCDCLSIPGNVAMVDPILFDKKRSRPDNQYDLSRTIAELALLHVATQRGMPILGVCGGHHVLAVYGGGEVRDLSSSEINEHHHDMTYDQVTLSAKSMLRDIMQPPTRCGLLKITRDPNLFTNEDLQRLLKRHDGCILYGDKIYYFDRTNEKLSDISASKEAEQLKEIIGLLTNDTLRISSDKDLALIASLRGHARNLSVFGAHFQGIETLGKESGHIATALGGDSKIIEATESKFGAPVVSTQFHPEIMAHGLFRPARNTPDGKIPSENTDGEKYYNRQHEGYLWAGGNPGRCGLLKVSTNPMACTFAEIEGQLIGKDAVIFFEDQLFYADLQKQEVTEVKMTAANNKAYDKLESYFSSKLWSERSPDHYRLVRKEEIQTIIDATGHNPPSRSEDEKEKIIRMGKAVFEFFRGAAFAYHNKKEALAELRKRSKPIASIPLSPIKPRTRSSLSYNAKSSFFSVDKKWLMPMLTGSIIAAALVFIFPPTGMSLTTLIGLGLSVLALGAIVGALLNAGARLLQTNRSEMISPGTTKKRVESPDVIMRETQAKLWGSLAKKDEGKLKANENILARVESSNGVSLPPAEPTIAPQVATEDPAIQPLNHPRRY